MDSSEPPSASPAPEPEQVSSNEGARRIPAFPVVGIGASAGGLRALQRLLAHIPADSGLAWVVVVHLAPNQESHLAGLLQPITPMPVRQVTEDVEIAPNQVYVIPPNRNLSTIDSHLRLSPLEEMRQARAPIDHFFRTLAESHTTQAVGVVLSGTGSDGAQGLAHIKELGGLSVVQDPHEAEYDSMPRNAIALGQVDLVLPLAEIPRQIIAYLQRRPNLPTTEESEQLPEGLRASLQQILALARLHTGHDFTHYKPGTILRRLQHRMRLLGLADEAHYLRRLRADPGEVRALANDFLISVTSFFRDPAAFARLEQEVIPQLFQGKGVGDWVRAWVVGCATGEEAYSIAILLLEYASQLSERPYLQVFATDLSELALQRGREGVYPETIAADVSAERLQRFFVEEPGGYRVRKEVREVVLFAPHSLLKDPPFSRMDLISCRNVLIYLDRGVHDQVLQLFHYALRPGGVLFLGTTEVLERSDFFHTLSRQHSLYQRRELAPQERHLLRLPLAQSLPDVSADVLAAPVQGRPITSAPRIDYGQVHGQFLERYGPPSLLVNADYNIVHFSHGVHRYLDTPPGEPTNQVLQRVREELRVELSAALHRAFSRGEPSISAPVVVQIEGSPRQVQVGVWGAEEGQPALVLFLEREPLVAAGGETRAAPEDGATVLALQEELATLRRQLQMTVEEYETTKEEMQASNEELLSMNEELRATAEELETSKEELQSINEELMTVNQENKHRLEELGQLSSDLQNLLAATDIAVLFLDRELRITRFTPRAGELFNVLPTDRNRPLAHLTHKLAYPHLLEDAAQVLRTLASIQREVQSQTGQWYLTRLLPYRSIEDRIEGVVITLVDITANKQTEEALRASEAQLAAELTAMQRLHESVARLLVAPDLSTALDEVLSATIEITGAQLGNIQLYNPATDTLELAAQHGFYKPFVEQFHTVRMDDYLPYSRALQARQRVIIEDVQTDPAFAPYRAVAEAAGYRAVQSTPLLSRTGELLGVLSTHYLQPHRPSERDLRLLDLFARQAADFIARVQSEAALREAQANLELALEAAQMGIFDLDVVNDACQRNLRHDQIFGYSELLPTWGRETTRQQVLPEDLEIFDAAIERALQTGIYDVEVRIRWPDGSVHWFHDLGRVYYDEEGQPVRIVGVTLDTTEQKQAQTAEMRQRIVQGQETERALLAREIHDGPVQELVAVTLELATLAQQIQDESLQLSLAVLRAKIEQINRQLRHIMVTLRPPMLAHFGLAPALAQHVEEVRLQQPGLNIETELAEPLPALSEEVMLAVYRIAQQALYNVVRHAQATHVWLRLRTESTPEGTGRLVLEVEDNGQGFVVPARWTDLSQQGHLGLIGMLERAERCGGRLEVISAPGKGTRLRAVVPLSAPLS
ncbi:MAG TPA: chemotaxis protein CheB [Caldilineaceae bacterium]|nr:chemotaxis protein CheB [Caldilineaceae bacterium]